jgi:hypothetical protein
MKKTTKHNVAPRHAHNPQESTTTINTIHCITILVYHTPKPNPESPSNGHLQRIQQLIRVMIRCLIENALQLCDSADLEGISIGTESFEILAACVQVILLNTNLPAVLALAIPFAIELIRLIRSSLLPRPRKPLLQSLILTVPPGSSASIVVRPEGNGLTELHVTIVSPR